MIIELTRDAERKRIERIKERNAQENKWELYSDDSIVRVIRKARDMGWKERRVQVRYDKDNEMYYIEPFEKDCGCRGMLRYKDFYD